MCRKEVICLGLTGDGTQTSQAFMLNDKTMLSLGNYSSVTSFYLSKSLL